MFVDVVAYIALVLVPYMNDELDTVIHTLGCGQDRVPLGDDRNDK